MRLHGGKWAYLKYPQHIQEADEASRNLSNYTTPEGWRKDLIRNVAAVRSLINLAPVETRSGQIYTLHEESKESINDAWNELHWAIHSALIHTRMLPPRLSEEEKAAKRDQYAEAQQDAAFKSFVQGLLHVEKGRIHVFR